MSNHLNAVFYRVISVILCLFIAITWYRPIAPYEQALHSSITVVGFVVWYLYLRHYRMSRWAFLLIAIFVALHTIGARWMYSFVPYNEWFRMVFGVGLNELMGWQRNHYDRMIHLMYGICLLPALTEWLQQRNELNVRVAAWMAVLLIMLTGLWYEWFEWAVALVLSPEDAEAYNGQQGDMWDAHKDMFIASIGSLISLAALRLWGNRF